MCVGGESFTSISQHKVYGGIFDKHFYKHVLSLGIFTLNAAPEDWAIIISLDLFASMHLSQQRPRFQETLC